MTAVPVPDDEEDDPEWWDLDSSESIPATMARSNRGPAVAVASTPAPAARTARSPALSTAPVKPRRPMWVNYAGIAVGGIIGVVLLVIVFSLASGSGGTQPKPVADQSASEPDAPPAPVAQVAETGSSSSAGGPAAHQAVVDDLTRAYNEIADGYAQIDDAATIPRGEGRISRGVEQLKAAAERGRSLPPLQPDNYAVLTGSKGPSLLQAVYRVIQQLRRLKATQGIKSDFDRLIDAYTRTRQEIDGRCRVPGPDRPGIPGSAGPESSVAPRIPPPGPTRRPRGRR